MEELQQQQGLRQQGLHRQGRTDEGGEERHGRLEGPERTWAQSWKEGMGWRRARGW